jgi:MFS family permease
MQPSISQPSISQPSISPAKAWLMVALCAIMMGLNYADKGILGFAAQPIMKELNLTQEQFGFLGSSFFFLFAISGIVLGFLSDRWPSKHVMTAMAVGWAVCLLPVAGPIGFTGLLVTRILLGATQGPATGVTHHFLFKWFPQEKRAFPAGVVHVGITGAIFLSAPTLGWVIRTYDWHMAFLVLGIVAVAIIPLWMWLAEEGPIADHIADTKPGAAAEPMPSYWRLMTNGTMLGLIATNFVLYWDLSLIVTWLPSFLTKGMGYAPANADWLVGLIWMASGICSPLVGWISQRLLKRGISSRWARGVFGSLSTALGGLLLVLMALEPLGSAKTALLLVGYVLSQNTAPLNFAMLTEITPSRRRGAVITMYTALLTTAGFIAPWAMGHSLQHAASAAEGFREGFVTVGVVTLVGGLIGLWLINPQADRERLAKRAGTRTADAAQAAA